MKITTLAAFAAKSRPQRLTKSAPGKKQKPIRTIIVWKARIARFCRLSFFYQTSTR